MMKEVVKSEESIKESKIPTLISLSEFIQTQSKMHKYPLISLGSYVVWIKKNGAPKRWPHEMWLSKLEEFLNHKISQ